MEDKTTEYTFLCLSNQEKSSVKEETSPKKDSSNLDTKPPRYIQVTSSAKPHNSKNNNDRVTSL